MLFKRKAIEPRLGEISREVRRSAKVRPLTGDDVEGAEGLFDPEELTASLDRHGGRQPSWDATGKPKPKSKVDLAALLAAKRLGQGMGTVSLTPRQTKRVDADPFVKRLTKLD